MASGTSWTPILKQFFRSSRTKMISKVDKSAEMKIEQNSCFYNHNAFVRFESHNSNGNKNHIIRTPNAFKTKNHKRTSWESKIDLSGGAKTRLRTQKLGG